ncbi:MAG: adenylate/guanylate cyclase domain-containing protein [Elusimicrobia bacterium]|nr:adenylate/guanylate cyclase domain-containing protein [Elusimicrobiota bacterium]
MKRKGFLAATLSLGCGAAMALLWALGVFEGLELKTLDFRFRLFPQVRRASADVVIVAIDEKSLLEFKRNEVVWKWPRDFYGALTSHLQRCGAKVIVFDELFSDPDIDRKGSDGAETDGAFAAAMKEAGSVVLAMQLSPEQTLITHENPLVKPPQLSLGPQEALNALRKYGEAVIPIEPFQRSALALGASNFTEDRDGIFRRVPLFFSYHGAAIPHLGMAAYLAAKGIRSAEFAGAGCIRSADGDIPLDPRGRFLVYWYGRGGPSGAFKYYSFAGVLRSMQEMARKIEPLIPASAFKDKVVIIGANAAGLFDYRSTPFTRDESYPGMEIHATIASNLLQKDFLRRAPGALTIAAIFLFAAAVCFLFLLGSRAHDVILVTLGCASAWVALAELLFRSQRLWLDVAAPEASLALAFAASAATSYALEGKERRKLKTMFSRYLSPVVISEVLEQREAVALGGQELVGTAFFSDLKDFTSTSEKMTPRDLVAFLNEYFSLTTDVILLKEGLLDKYIGDAIMAVFGAPLPSKTHAQQACAAALEIQRLLGSTRISRGPSPSAQKTRIGINTGPMVVGNIGCPSRMDYTAIGDTVNLASRLEGANKNYGTEILIGETTFQEAGEHFETRELDRIAVKGKRCAVVVYELLGRKGSLPEALAAKKRLFKEGLGRYRNREFAGALSVFESVLAGEPGDGPSELYVRRCRKFLAEPPPADWDGVFHSESK